MQGQHIKLINDSRLGDVLSHPGLSVLLITSPWDGHGIIMRTLLEGFASRYQRVFFGVADVEKSPRLCRLFNITNPPALLLVHDGELKEKVSGAVGGSTIEELIARNS